MTMATLEDLKRGAVVKGVVPDGNVTVVDVDWHGTDAITLVYRRDDGGVADRLVFRDDEARSRAGAWSGTRTGA